MRLLAHLVAGDIRRHRWLLASWVAVVVAGTVVTGVHPLFAARPTASTVDLLHMLLTVLRLFLRILLIALVVQIHPLVGSDAFWLTRPIPRMTLLACKTIVLAAFLVFIPVAAEAVLMTIYGIQPGEIARVAVESAQFATFWVALLATAAALTPTFPRFLLLCGGVLAALALLLAVQITIDSMAPATPPLLVAQAPGPENPTGVAVVVGMLILACAVTLIAQYRSRRLWRSSLIAVLALVIALYGAGVWPWQFLQANVELPAWASGDASLPIVVRTVATRSTDEGMIEKAPRRKLAAPVQVSGLAPGWSAAVGLLQASLQLDGGRTLTSVSFPFREPVTTDGETPSRVAAIRGLVGEILEEPSPLFAVRDKSLLIPAATLLVVPEPEFTQVAPARGHYSGRFFLQLTHHRIEATIAIRPGAQARNGNYHVTLDSARAASGRAVLQLRESDATSSFDRRPHAEQTYYLRNRRSGAAVEGSVFDFDRGILPRMTGGMFQGSIGFGGDTTGFRAGGHAVWFPPPGRSFGPLGETWLQDAELVIVRSTVEGSVERKLEIDGLPLDATAPAQR